VKTLMPVTKASGKRFQAHRNLRKIKWLVVTIKAAYYLPTFNIVPNATHPLLESPLGFEDEPDKCVSLEHIYSMCQVILF